MRAAPESHAAVHKDAETSVPPVEDRQQLLGTGPPSVVRLRPGIKDLSILITHEDGCHGKLPALVAIVLRKVQPLGPVNVPNSRLNREDQVQAPRISLDRKSVV